MRFFFVAFITAGLALSGTVATAYSGEIFRVCGLDPNGDNFLAFRTCGSTKCRMTRKLGPGTYVMSLDPFEENGWRAVILMRNRYDESYEGPNGWVYGRYLCPVYE